MSTTSNFPNTLSDDASSLVHAVAQTTGDAMRATQRATQQGMDRLSDDVGNVRGQASTAFQHLKSDTEALAHRGMDAVRDSASQLREKSLHAKEATTSYIQHEPVKSVLMAAAVGAALMGLLALFSSRHGHNGR